MHTSRFLPEQRPRTLLDRRWGRCRAKPDGWGMASRFAKLGVRGAVHATLAPPKTRPTPHPALRATFPSRTGEGAESAHRGNGGNGRAGCEAEWIGGESA